MFAGPPINQDQAMSSDDASGAAKSLKQVLTEYDAMPSA